MNKKIILILAISLSCTAQANWYAGANLGVNTVDIEKKLTYPFNILPQTSAHFHNTYTNFHEQLITGFEFILFKQIGLALEGNIDLFNGKSTYSIHNWFFSESAKATEKLQYGFGLFILPEYQYHPAIRLFAGPGVDTSQFAIGYKNTAGNVGVTTKNKQWLVGWSFKIGLISQIYDNTELVFTYLFSQYNSVNWTRMEPLSGDFLRGQYKPSVNLFMLGFKVNVPDGSAKYNTK